MPEVGMFFVCKSDIELGKWLVTRFMQKEPTFENGFNNDFYCDDIGFFPLKEDAIFALEAFESRREMDKNT